MERRTGLLSITLVVTLAGLAGLLLLGPQPESGALHCVQYEAEYLPFEQMLAQADLIVIGKVGGYVRQQGDFHGIKIRVSTNLKGHDGPVPGRTIAIMAGGNSPLDGCPEPSHDPEICQQVIAFAHLADLSTGGSVTHRTYRLMTYYVLAGDEIYRGGPDEETIALVDLLHRMGEIAAAKRSPADMGFREEDPPPGMTPAISREKAIQIAMQGRSSAGATPMGTVNARFAIITYPQHWKEPVWIVTITGLRMMAWGCIPPGDPRITRLPCPYNSELNVLINAMTGENIGAFSYR